MSAGGKPSDIHPKRVAADLGLPVSGQASWTDLLEAACGLYWQRRVPITTDELLAYREQRRQEKADARRAALKQRQIEQDTTPPAVWIRRAGAA